MAILISDTPLKINGFDRKVDYITLKSIPDPIASYLLVVAIVSLILGSAFFMFGENQELVDFLLLFLIPKTIISHVFPFHQIAVLMNLGLIGGLIISSLSVPT